GGVRARARLGERECGGDLTRGEARQIAALLLRVAAEDDRIAAEVLHEEDRGGRRAGPRHLLRGETEGQRAGGAAAVLLGDGEPHQALLAEELELIGRVLAGLVDVRGQRRDALAGDLTREVADRSLLVAQVVELIHGDVPAASL